MIGLHPTSLQGAYLIDLCKIEDERGFFGTLFSAQEFAKLGLESQFVQVNSSLSLQKGTLRGLHYQTQPMASTKLVRCIQGSLYDVILDLRPNSKTFCHFFAVELSAKNRQMIYVPQGFAHGFLTLEDNTEILYLTSAEYSPECERGVRWNDPLFSIPWPIQPTVLSDRDRHHPNYKREP